MSALKGIGLMVAGVAIGLGSGYAAFKADTPRCEDFYKTQVESVEQKYSGIETTNGLASIKDVDIGYVVSKEPEFKGLTWKDNLTGDDGVITRHVVLGKVAYTMQKADLSALLESKDSAAVTVQPKIVTYAKND